MIIAPPPCNSDLATAWISGVALAVLAVGVYGATQRLVPARGPAAAGPDETDEIMVVDLALSPSVEDTTQDAPPEPEVDLEIPPLPEIAEPITPPEMVELTPLENPPPPAPAPPKPKPQTRTRRTVPAEAASSGMRSGSSGSDHAPATNFTGAGGGRFPSPGYPAAARARSEEGLVRLLVTVEASGLPSTVSVQSSSGSATLDTAARDHISRHWRWPAGAARKYIVPIRFRLE